MYEKEVAKGAAWLDQNSPEWWKDLDIKRLRMENCDECVLGLIFGPRPSSNLNGDTEFANSHGFALPVNHQSVDGEKIRNAYKPLAAEWIREILRRRAAERLTQVVQEIRKDKVT